MARVSPPPFRSQLTPNAGVTDPWTRWFNEVYQAFKTSDVTLLATHEIDTESAVEFLNGITNDYSAYVIELTNIVVSTSSEQLKLVTSRDAGITWDVAGADYSWMYKLRDVTGTTVAESTVGSDAASAISLTAADISTASTAALSGSITIHYPTNEVTYKPINSELTYMDTDSRLQLVTGTSRLNKTAVINAFKIYCATGRMTSGTISLYGRL